MILDELRFHPFTQRALRDAVLVQKALGGSLVKTKAEYQREPDEHEFYVLRVGHALAELLTCCEQVSDAVEYLSHTPSQRLKSKGIHRQRHLLYHIENHTIRSHSVYDRTLQLVDSVFHLLNAATECSHQTIVGNLKVKRTMIPAKLKAVRKVVAPTTDTRHEIINRESYKDDALRELEMYCIVETFSKENDEGPLRLSRVKARQRELARQLISERKGGLRKLNAKLFQAVHDLLSALDPICQAEKRLVEVRVHSGAK